MKTLKNVTPFPSVYFFLNKINRKVSIAYESLADLVVDLWAYDSHILHDSYRVGENFKDNKYDEEQNLIEPYAGIYVIYDNEFNIISREDVLHYVNKHVYKRISRFDLEKTEHNREKDLIRAKNNLSHIKEYFIHVKEQRTRFYGGIETIYRNNNLHTFRHVRSFNARKQLSFLDFDEDLKGLKVVSERRRTPPSSWDDLRNQKMNSMKSWKTHSKRRKQWIPKN